ncbi:MAG: hypothetical protein EPO29_00025 [Betaproteobacteria bacterium]|nr:MAG: hypothetical protein EPO29_00025 [Betaproteobacteria bacterium]
MDLAFVVDAVFRLCGLACLAWLGYGAWLCQYADLLDPERAQRSPLRHHQPTNSQAEVSAS